MCKFNMFSYSAHESFSLLDLALAMAGGLLVALGVDLFGDARTNLPKRLIEDVLLALAEQVHGHSAGPDDAAAYYALRELQMVETEELQSLIKVKHIFGDLVITVLPRIGEASAVDVIHGDSGFLKSSEKRVS
jgi:hypothetical protein